MEVRQCSRFFEFHSRGIPQRNVYNWCYVCLQREDPEVLLEERQQLKTDIEDQLEEVGRDVVVF